MQLFGEVIIFKKKKKLRTFFLIRFYVFHTFVKSARNRPMTTFPIVTLTIEQ